MKTAEPYGLFGKALALPCKQRGPTVGRACHALSHGGASLASSTPLYHERQLLSNYISAHFCVKRSPKPSSIFRIMILNESKDKGSDAPAHRAPKGGSKGSSLRNRRTAPKSPVRAPPGHGTIGWPGRPQRLSVEPRARTG